MAVREVRIGLATVPHRDRISPDDGRPWLPAPVIDDARGGFVLPRMPESLSVEDRRSAQVTIQSAYAATIRLVLLIAAGLALAGALAATLTIEPGVRERNPP